MFLLFRLGLIFDRRKVTASKRDQNDDVDDDELSPVVHPPPTNSFSLREKKET
jgi:hypothetical protein